MALVILNADDLRERGWEITSDGTALVLGGVTVNLVFPYPKQSRLIVHEEDSGAFVDVRRDLTSCCAFCVNCPGCVDADGLEHPECFEV